jgi:ankyrin repeat protein
MAAINTGFVETFAELALHDPTIITYTYGIFGNCLMSALRLPNLATFLAYLLEHGANPNNGLGTRLCPLSQAAGIGDVESVRLLLRHGAEIKDSGALWHAVCAGQRKIVEFLLDYGADINNYVS